MQGQGGTTKFKELRFELVIAQGLRISKALSVAKWPYYHVDLNAGGGYNTELSVPVPGSPLNFLKAAARNQRSNFFAFFVDHNEERIQELITRPEIEAVPDRVFIDHGDNAEILPVVSEFIAARERAQYAMGSILIDPNGFHKGVPWDPLQSFCATFPRMDLVLNLNVRTYKLERPHIEKGAGAWGRYQLHPMSTFPAWFSRRNWMLTEPLQINGDRFVQLVGRTMQTAQPDYRSLGFYDLASDRGQRIVADIEGPSTSSPAEFSLLPNL